MIKVGVPTGSDLVLAQHSQSDKAKIESEPVFQSAVSREERLYEAQAEPVSLFPVSHSKRL